MLLYGDWSSEVRMQSSLLHWLIWLPAKLIPNRYCLVLKLYKTKRNVCIFIVTVFDLDCHKIEPFYDDYLIILLQYKINIDGGWYNPMKEYKQRKFY